MSYFDGHIKELTPPDMSSIDRLNDRLRNEDIDWNAYDRIKPNRFGVFEDSTEHIVFQFVDFKKKNISSFYFPWWKDWKDHIEPIIEQVSAYYPYKKGKTFRIMLAKLKAGCRIDLHVDGHRFADIPHKIHIPLKTSPEVTFLFEDFECHLEVGKAYEVNNKIRHGGVNNSPEDRIHLIFEYFDAEETR